jgi:hypothetical protein
MQRKWYLGNHANAKNSREQFAAEPKRQKSPQGIEYMQHAPESPQYPMLLIQIGLDTFMTALAPVEASACTLH